jgi:hypothetical protein
VSAVEDNRQKMLSQWGRADAERRSTDKLVYQYKVADKIAKSMSINRSHIHDNYQACLNANAHDDFLRLCKEDGNIQFPDPIYIEKLKGVNLLSILSKPQETTVWKNYLKLISQHNTVAYIFPVKNRKDWVIHNMYATKIQGVGRVHIPSAGVHRPIEIIPFNLFTEEVLDCLT